VAYPGSAGSLAHGGHGAVAAHDDHAHAHHPALQHHFDTLDQQQHASLFGMWVFLVTEVLFFGGLFMAYVLYRTWYPDMFVAASSHLDIKLGAINTIVLIGSSLTMALAVRAGQLGNNKGIIWLIALTMLLGSIFLGIKVIEYSDKFAHHLVPGPNFQFSEPWGANAQLYFSLYFAMTGLHATHMIIGMGIMLVIIAQAAKGKFSAEYNTPVEIIGLYWHFVDIVWIFLFPLLYLIGGAHG
jgi:cytochrome c oxidase subunit 3